MRSIQKTRCLLLINFLTPAFLSVGMLCGCQSSSTGPNSVVVTPSDSTHTGSKDSVTTDPNDKATLILAYPIGGDRYKLGDSLHVKAMTDGNGRGTINAVDVFLSPDAGNTWGMISERSLPVDAHTDLYFAWKIPEYFSANGKRFLLAEDGNCRIRIAQHNSGDSLKIARSGSFLIEDTVFIRLTTPLGGESYHVGDTLRIGWTVKENPDNPIDAVDPMLSPDSGRTWIYLRMSSIPPESPVWGRFTWIIPDSVSDESGKKTGLVGNPGVCVRVQQYSTADPKQISQSGMISISPR